jgi:hypothetical protein
MDGFFYASSMHSNIEVPVPDCFVELEKLFAGSVPTNVRPDDAPGVGEYVALADNLCRRLGDVDYYAKLVTDEMATMRGTWAAKATCSLLVGYFSACKSVLDAGAIALSKLYALGVKTGRKPLANKEMDFARTNKRNFWWVLLEEQPAVHARYIGFAGTFGEIFNWRDAAVHRIHPFVIATVTRDSETNVHSMHGFDLVLDADPAFSKLWHQDKPWKYAEPLHFH